ncbi:MAG: hypothetical protein ACK5Y2_01685 [Bdellovibrionales bacterium]
MTLSSRFADHLCQHYPALKAENLEAILSPQLLSPHKVSLPKFLLQQIELTIQSFQQLRELPDYQNWAAQTWGPLWNPGNYGVFMSYDFHVTADGHLKLIEINTNASFLGLGWEMARFQGVPWNAAFHLADLKQCFEMERQLCGLSKPLRQIAIVDDNPTQQKLYLEFLLFREVFKSWGLSATIADLRDHATLKNADFVYNRSTDFYFQSESLQFLKDLYLKKDAVVSPHPYEYRLLADKENFVRWTSPQFWQDVPQALSLQSQILSVLPNTTILNSSNRDEIWAKRKHLFFKPKRAFGSKMTFKGASIAHKVFEELVQSESLAQELIPAPELRFGEQNFKYDLRCYAYRGQYQGCVARLYQGQVTNLRTEGGGFACVEFKD